MPEGGGGIAWDGPELNIPWPLEEYHLEREHLIMTERDKNLQTFREYRKGMGYSE